jgi:hypothetical protein
MAGFASMDPETARAIRAAGGRAARAVRDGKAPPGGRQADPEYNVWACMVGRCTDYRRSNMPPSMMANIATVSLAEFTRSVVDAESDNVVTAEERVTCAQKLEHHIGVVTTHWQELRG